MNNLTQTEVDCHKNETAKDSSGTLSNLENFLDNIHVNQVRQNTTDNTPALYERLLSHIQSKILHLREQVKSRDCILQGRNFILMGSAR